MDARLLQEQGLTGFPSHSQGSCGSHWGDLCEHTQRCLCPRCRDGESCSIYDRPRVLLVVGKGRRACHRSATYQGEGAVVGVGMVFTSCTCSGPAPLLIQCQSHPQGQGRHRDKEGRRAFF